MKYRVNFEETVRTEIIVEAKDYEEAAILAKQQKPTRLAENMNATWIGTEEKFQEIGEYEYEIIGTCNCCGAPIVERDIPGQPWLYGSSPDRDDLACFKCLTDQRTTQISGESHDPQ